jgi:hypothetical protein
LVDRLVNIKKLIYSISGEIDVEGRSNCAIKVRACFDGAAASCQEQRVIFFDPFNIVQR